MSSFIPSACLNLETEPNDTTEFVRDDDGRKISSLELHVKEERYVGKDELYLKQTSLFDICTMQVQAWTLSLRYSTPAHSPRQYHFDAV